MNSQSGKGGVAYLLEAEFGVVMPRRLQVEFSGEVQSYTDQHGGEMSAQDIWALFSSTYLDSVVPLRYVGYQLIDHPHDATGQGIRLTVDAAGARHTLHGAVEPSRNLKSMVSGPEWKLYCVTESRL